MLFVSLWDVLHYMRAQELLVHEHYEERFSM